MASVPWAADPHDPHTLPVPGGGLLPAHLHIDVNLGARMQLCQDGRLEGLTQLQAHLTRLPIPMWPPLALTCAEGCRTVLTVHQGPVWQGSCPGAPDLGEKRHMSQAYSSQLTLALPLAQA